MTEQELRDSYAGAIAGRGEGGRDACCAPDAIVALVQRDGAEATRMTTLDHVMSCESCRREFDLLTAIERAGRHETRRSVERIHWRRYATIAVAASLVLAVGLGRGHWFGEQRAADDMVRGQDSPGVVLLAPEEGASLAEAGVFTWRAFPGATRYTFELVDAGGNVRFSRQLPDTSMTADKVGVAPGDYQWIVRVTGEDGVERRSVPRAIRITAR